MTQILAPADRGSALQKVIDELKGDSGRLPTVTALRHFPALPAHFADFPDDLRPELVDALRRRGIDRLYSHQREAYEKVSEGDNVVVVTPTASGKTLCYNLPVLNRVLEEPETRALYLFPTKALSQDQLSELHGLIQDLGDIGADIRTFTYDGDTPQDARKAIRARGHLVVTNPDMLHSGILPHHPKWVKLFENLRYIVIDEVHAYRGVFGSHLANILRRLRRVLSLLWRRPAVHLLIGHDREPQGADRRAHRQPSASHQQERCSSRREVLRFLQPAGGEPGGSASAAPTSTRHAASPDRF